MKHQLLERVQTLLADSPVAAAGKLQMIGVSQIRDRLGDRWEKSREHIATTIERAIGQEMGAGDIYFKVDDLAYVILFGDRDINESRLICAKIAQSVCRKLFGEDEDLVRIRSLTCAADGSVLAQNVDIEDTLHALIEAEGEEEIFGLHGKLESQAPPENADLGEERLPSVLDSHGAHAAAGAADLKFEYSPVWDVSKHVVVTYLCRAQLTNAHHHSELSGERFVLAEEPEHQVDIDLRILRDCAQKIRDLKIQNRRVLLICPVHWSTISRARAWERFKPLLQSLSNDVAQDLIVGVHGLDAGLPNIRIAQEFPKLANRCRTIYACVAYGDKVVERFAGTQTSAVGFVTPNDFADERALISNAREFCVHADGKHLPAFAFGVAKRRVAMALIGLGFRYLEGHAIRHPTSMPRTAFSHETIDLFRSDLQGNAR